MKPCIMLIFCHYNNPFSSKHFALQIGAAEIIRIGVVSVSYTHLVAVDETNIIRQRFRLPDAPPADARLRDVFEDLDVYKRQASS